MTLLFCDGFDKYGTLNTTPAIYLTQEWTTASASCAIVAGLSSSGSALSLNSSSANVQKTLAANYSRLIGGLRFASTLPGAVNNGVVFSDAGTAQASITINSTGTISIRAGGLTGAAIATSTASVAANSTHYLEWDLSFSNTGSYQLWLDGVSILSGTGDTTGTANNYANSITVGTTSGGGGFTVDDLYLFDSTGTTANAVLLTSPRVETQFPNSDASVQFGVGAATLGVGGTTSRGSGPASGGLSAILFLRPLTANRSCTLNSIAFTPLFTNAAANYRVCIYADSAGNPGTLMGSSSTITGATSGTTITGTLTTPQSLAAGTQYWLGVITDVGASNIASSEVPGQGKYASNTFASGPPSTAPSMLVNSGPSPMFWGNVSGTGANYYEVGQNPPSGNLSYVTDTTVGHEDLYGFPALSAIPAVVHAVAVKANIARSDSGARSVSVRMSSGGTDSGSASLTPGTTYGWLPGIFQTDPNTGAAWTGTNLNAATCGIKIDA
jgi:hypothetical protein